MKRKVFDQSAPAIAAVVAYCIFASEMPRATAQPQSITSASSAPRQSPIILTDVTDRTGIDFVHTDGSYGKYFLVEAMSAGLALLDYDQDGDADVYFLNGAPINAKSNLPGAVNSMFRNDGDFRFKQVTRESGVGDDGMGLGVACADFDNDGFVDIYVNNYGPNVLYHNNGDGTFTDVTHAAGVSNGSLVGAGAAFFDMEADGDLDLYVGNYIQFDPALHRVHIHKGLPSYPSPLSFSPQFDTLYRNNGDGTFADVSKESGIHAVAGRSMGLLAFDYDADGDSDVVVANDTQENFLFENDGKGYFTEVGVQAGIAYDYRGKPQASMGVALLDIDHNGLLDLYFTSFSEEFATLYTNLGSGLFDDATLRAGASEATFPHVKWGVVAVDFDNDGNRDLLIGAGDLDDQRDKRGGVSKSTAFRVPNVLLRASSNGTLHDMKHDWGSAAQVSESTRGLVAGDLDNDGRVDCIALNARARPTVMRNESELRPYLKLRLIGTRENRDGIGALISVERGGDRQVMQTHCGNSYQSDCGQEWHFGLAPGVGPIRISIRWPDGSNQSLELAAPPTSVVKVLQFSP